MTKERFLAVSRRLLEHPRLPLILACLAVVVSAPAVFTGWGPMDDLRHRSKLVDPSRLPEKLHEIGLVPDESGQLGTVLSEMHTINRTKDEFGKLRDYGIMHWWTQEDYRASNWRPVDSLTHWLDYRLWPNTSALIHVQNILWFTAIVLLVTVFYRRLIGPGWIAGLAALMYVLDDSNYLPALWIANRCLLISLVFALLCVLAYHKWRSTGSVTAAVGSSVFLLVSLLASEAGIATFAYLFAYAVALDRGSLLKRFGSLVPAFVIIMVWRAVYSKLGNGAYGSGFVIDPGREPLSFVLEMLQRGPILLFAQLGGPPSETFSFMRESYRPYLVATAYVFLLAVLVVLWPLVRRDRLARFWLLAMLASVVPICATVAMNRNLLYVAVAAFALVGQFIGAWSSKESWLPSGRGWRTLAKMCFIVFILAHIVLAVFGRIAGPITISQTRKQFKATMDVGTLAGVQEQDLVIVNAPNPFSLFFMPTYRAHVGQALPKGLRVLAPGFARVDITRVDERTLRVRAESGNLFSGRQKRPFHVVYMYEMFNEGFRHRNYPMHTGDTVELPRMKVEVTEVDMEGLPVEAVFRFAAPLDDASLRWLRWDWHDKTYVPFELPDVGQQVHVKGRF